MMLLQSEEQQSACYSSCCHSKFQSHETESLQEQSNCLLQELLQIDRGRDLCITTADIESPSQSSEELAGPSARQLREEKVRKYLQKKRRRRFAEKVVYQSRREVSNSRVRVKGRFVSKKEERRIKEALGILPKVKRGRKPKITKMVSV